MGADVKMPRIVVQNVGCDRLLSEQRTVEAQELDLIGRNIRPPGNGYAWARVVRFSLAQNSLSFGVILATDPKNVGEIRSRVEVELAACWVAAINDIAKDSLRDLRRPRPRGSPAYDVLRDLVANGGIREALHAAEQASVLGEPPAFDDVSEVGHETQPTAEFAFGVSMSDPMDLSERVLRKS